MAWSDAARRAAEAARRMHREMRAYRATASGQPVHPVQQAFTPEARLKLARQLRSVRSGSRLRSVQSAEAVAHSAAVSTAHRNAAKAYNAMLRRMPGFKSMKSPFKIGGK